MSPSNDPNRIHEADLWIPCLIILKDSPNGEIETSDLIEKLKKVFPLSPEDEQILENRSDTKFSQIVRNIKSHSKSCTNPIYKGYMEAIPRGFRITQKGINFVETIRKI